MLKKVHLRVKVQKQVKVQVQVKGQVQVLVQGQLQVLVLTRTSTPVKRFISYMQLFSVIPQMFSRHIPV